MNLGQVFGEMQLKIYELEEAAAGRSGLAAASPRGKRAPRCPASMKSILNYYVSVTVTGGKVPCPVCGRAVVLRRHPGARDKAPIFVAVHSA